jgi:PEGA domain
MVRAIRFFMLALTLLGTVASNRGLAFAEDVDALIKKGIELRRQGKEQDALQVFQRAAAISRAPRVVAQVALAEQALGIWADAERDLTEALAAGAKEPWIIKNRRQLEEALRVIQSHLGSLEIWGQPPGTEIVIDGAVVGKLPMSTALRLPIGEISLTLRKDGYDKITRVVSISKGDHVRENIVLHATAAAPVVKKPLALSLPADVSPGAAPPTLTTIKGPPEPPPEEPASAPIYKRWWFWTGIAVVAIGAGAGAYLLTRPACTPGPNNWCPN